MDVMPRTSDASPRISIDATRKLVGTFAEDASGVEFPIPLPCELGNLGMKSELADEDLIRVQSAVTSALDETDPAATCRMIEGAATYAGRMNRAREIDLSGSDLVRAAGGGTNLAALICLQALQFHVRMGAGGQDYWLTDSNHPEKRIEVNVEWDGRGASLEPGVVLLYGTFPDTVADALPGRRVGDVVSGLPEAIADEVIEGTGNASGHGAVIGTLSLFIRKTGRIADLRDLRDLRAADCVPLLPCGNDDQRRSSCCSSDRFAGAGHHPITNRLPKER